MNTEEKAKAYDEALKTATQWIKDGCSDKEKICLESIFPQLRESEDEKIRKLLVWQVYRNIEDETNDLAGSVYDGIKGHDPDLEESIEDWKKCLAWLEKQKEQKEIPLMNGDADLFFDEWNQQHSNPTKRECFEAGMLYAVRLLTEDSPMLEEFKKGLEQVILWGKEGYKVSPDGTTKSLTQDEIDEVLDEQKEQKPRWEINNPHTTKWTKEMIDEKFEELVEEYHKQKPVVTHGETYHVDTLGTQQVIAGKMPQKPAEWSEEDEEMLNSCISSIEESKENRYAYKENDGDTSYDREIAWLKSLRPSWKPSEEQMKALYCAIEDVAKFSKRGGHQVELENEPYYSALHSLYCNLEKLM